MVARKYITNGSLEIPSLYVISEASGLLNLMTLQSALLAVDGGEKLASSVTKLSDNQIDEEAADKSDVPSVRFCCWTFLNVRIVCC